MYNIVAVEALLIGKQKRKNVTDAGGLKDKIEGWLLLWPSGVKGKRGWSSVVIGRLRWGILYGEKKLKERWKVKGRCFSFMCICGCTVVGRPSVVEAEGIAASSGKVHQEAS